jgi:hypothetical protein
MVTDRHEQRDVFICHASEDKEGVVQPLVEACLGAGISCWYDQDEIQWGDSITQGVNAALGKSRFVVVVFSNAFVGKNWPKRELNAVLNQEATTGEVRILPLLVGTASEKQQIMKEFPLLNDKKYLPWDGDFSRIVSSLQARLQRSRDGVGARPATGGNPGPDIPLPKIRKTFTQRDKDLFLRNGFVVVKGYFRNALQQMERRLNEVKTDFAEVHAFKFVATIYVRGEVGNKCKIWLGGYTSTDSIAYQEGQVRIDTDNSMNDVLSVETEADALGFRPSGMRFGAPRSSESDLMSAEEAAEYLWTEFTANLK